MHPPIVIINPIPKYIPSCFSTEYSIIFQLTLNTSTRNTHTKNPNNIINAIQNTSVNNHINILHKYCDDRLQYFLLCPTGINLSG
jgi:hypothetical protein